LGLEGSFTDVRVNEENVNSGGVDYDLEANVNSLGGLLTVGYDVELSPDFGLSVTGGAGYYSNTTEGKLTEGTTEHQFAEHTRYSLGAAGEVGLSFSPSANNSFSLGYRLEYAGPSSSGKATTTPSIDSNAVIDFGNTLSHQVHLGASFSF